MVSDIICSQCRIPCRGSQGNSTRDILILLLEEVYTTKSTEKNTGMEWLESLKGSRIKWINKSTLPLHDSAHAGNGDLLHSSGHKKPKCMYASAITRVRQLTSLHPPFLQSPAWLSVLSRHQKFLFSRLFTYESYWSLKISMPSSIFMNTSGCKQIPEIKEVLCRTEPAVSNQMDPRWH